MFPIIPILIIILISLAFKKLFVRPLNETFPFVIFGTIAIVYIFGLLGVLLYARFFIAFLGLLSLLLLLYQGIHKPSTKRRLIDIFSFDVFFVVGGVLLIMLFAVGRKVTDMDAFEQWAYIVKRMSFAGSLHAAQGQYSTTALNPPGVALLQYYIGSFSHEFSESNLFVGKNLLIFALLLPVFGLLEKKNWKSLMFLIPIAIFLPFTEYTTFDSSLEVDPLLGLLFGFLIIYGVKNDRVDISDYFNILLGSFVLSLSKTTGFLFCGLAAVIVLFLRLQSRVSHLQTNLLERKSKRWLLPALGIVIVAIIGSFSWFLYVRSSGAEIAQSNPLSLQGGLAQFQKETIVNFLNSIFLPEGTSGFNNLSPVSWIFAVPILSVVLTWFFTQNKALRKRSFFGAVLLVFGYLVWMLLLLIGYLISFSPGEAMALAAFSRYLSAYQLGTLLICAVWLIEAIQDKQSQIKLSLLALFVCLLAIITPLHSVFDATIGSPYANGKTADWRMRYEPSSRYYNLLDVNSVKICFLDQSEQEPGFSFALFQFEALPYNVQKAVAWRFGGPYYKDDFYSLSPSASEWEAALMSGGFTHLYLRQINQYFLENYATLFENPNDIRADSYYLITLKNGHVQFVYISID